MKEKKDKIRGLKDLQAAIQNLEEKRVALEAGIGEDFQVLQQSLKPSAIIKNTLHELKGSSDLGKGILRFAMALGAGYFSKRLISGKSAGMAKKAMGAAIQYAMMALVTKKTGAKETTSSDGSSFRVKRLLRQLLSI